MTYAVEKWQERFYFDREDLEFLPSCEDLDWMGCLDGRKIFDSLEDAVREFNRISTKYTGVNLYPDSHDRCLVQYHYCHIAKIDEDGEREDVLLSDSNLLNCKVFQVKGQ